MSKYPMILIDKEGDDWRWVFAWVGMHGEHDYVASGTSPDYDEACRCARIAWEQHSEGEK